VQRVSGERIEHLTRAQLETLRAELAELEGPKRAEIVAAIARAREYGDLSENFEYHAAKNEQGLLERRIALLRARIGNGVLIDEEAAARSDTVTIGSKVELEVDRGERMEIEISGAGGISPDSPLGRALLGARVGDEREVPAPGGTWRARVVSLGD
jgi:transcription elongation factor GreA